MKEKLIWSLAANKWSRWYDVGGFWRRREHINLDIKLDNADHRHNKGEKWVEIGKLARCCQRYMSDSSKYTLTWGKLKTKNI